MVNNEKTGDMSFVEVITSMRNIDPLMKKLVEVASSSSSYDKLSIYLSIVEVQNSTFIKLSELGLNMLELFIEHRALTAEEISKRLKCSRRWALELCHSLMKDADLLKVVIRERVHIFVLNTANEQDINRAAAVWDTLKHSFSEKYSSKKKSELQLFKCLDCKTVFKAYQMPKKCPACECIKICRYIVDKY